jgi:hypothetical protein
MFDTLLRNTRDPLSSATIVGAPAGRRRSTLRGWPRHFSNPILVWTTAVGEAVSGRDLQGRNAKASLFGTTPQHPSPGQQQKNESIPISGLGPSPKESSPRPSWKFPGPPGQSIFFLGDTQRDERRMNKVRHKREAIMLLLSAADTETTPLAHSLSRNERPPATRST